MLDRIVGKVVWISGQDGHGLQLKLDYEGPGELVGDDPVTCQKLNVSESEADKGISMPKMPIQGTWS